MKRTPIKRSTKRIPTKRAKPRRGRQEDKAYRAWLRENGWCVICGLRNPDPAHTKNGGMGMKGPDSSCAPLCRDHHRLYDGDRKAFEVWHKKDMTAVAARWFARFEKENGKA